MMNNETGMKKKCIRTAGMISAVLFVIIVSVRCAGAPESFVFVQLTDPQLGFASSNAGFGDETDNMEKAVAMINGMKPDFVVITGDLVNKYDDVAQLDEFERLLDMFNDSIPVYLLPGNHDTPKVEGPSSLESYIGRYGYDRFSFKHKSCLFTGINSNIIKDGCGQLEEEQYAWLDSLLSVDGVKARHAFVFMHCPPFARSESENEAYSNFSSEDRKKYMELFVEKGVDAVFAGHLHHAFDAVYKDCRIVTSAPVSMHLGEGGYSGMTVVRVSGDGFEYENVRF